MRAQPQAGMACSENPALHSYYNVKQFHCISVADTKLDQWQLLQAVCGESNIVLSVRVQVNEQGLQGAQNARCIKRHRCSLLSLALCCCRRCVVDVLRGTG